MNIYEENTNEANPIEVTLDELNSIVAACNEVIELGNSAKELLRNNDFIKVVVDGYMKKETNRLAGLLASGKLNQSTTEGTVSDLKAIGAFNVFFNSLIENGKIAQNTLENAKAEYDEYVENNKA